VEPGPSPAQHYAPDPPADYTAIVIEITADIWTGQGPHISTEEISAIAVPVNPQPVVRGGRHRAPLEEGTIIYDSAAGWRYQRRGWRQFQRTKISPVATFPDTGVFSDGVSCCLDNKWLAFGAEFARSSRRLEAAIVQRS